MDQSQVLEHVKAILRITTDDVGINAEIQNLIDSAIMDLRMSGINQLKLTYPLDSIIVRAISLYAKANFGFDNPDSEKLMESYRSLETHLALSEEYRGVVVDETP